jgi:hypothetical protein
MDSLPPNDPNRNNNNNHNHPHGSSSAPNGKEAPYDGRRNSNSNNNNGRQRSEVNGDGVMDLVGGDLRDAPAVVVLFLVGVATWFLRERCIC